MRRSQLIPNTQYTYLVTNIEQEFIKNWWYKEISNFITSVWILRYPDEDQIGYFIS
jgi:hypothetical protein